MKGMLKIFNDESEWEIFQRVFESGRKIWARHSNEQSLCEELVSAKWVDNTNAKPDFISENLMLEMFEIDDIVTTKKGKNNPQRKTDARTRRDVQKFIDEVGDFREDIQIIAHGDTRYNPEMDNYEDDRSEDHHNYQAYINNFQRICQNHLDSVPEYRKKCPDKKLGFLIIDDASFYVPKLKMTVKETISSLPFFDKNFIRLFVKSDVDFVVWAFNNKYLHTLENKHGQDSLIPDVTLITKDYYYSKFTKLLDANVMKSLEE